MVNRKKLANGYIVRHYGTQYEPKKPGLYLTAMMWGPKERFRISDKEVIEIRDWFSRYINTHIMKTTSPLIPDMKAKSRSITRGLEKLEAEYRVDS